MLPAVSVDRGRITSEQHQSSSGSVSRPPLSSGLGPLVWSDSGAHPSTTAAFTSRQTNCTKWVKALKFVSTELNKAGVKALSVHFWFPLDVISGHCPECLGTNLDSLPHNQISWGEVWQISSKTQMVTSSQTFSKSKYYNTFLRHEIGKCGKQWYRYFISVLK